LNSAHKVNPFRQGAIRLRVKAVYTHLRETKSMDVEKEIMY